MVVGTGWRTSTLLLRWSARVPPPAPPLPQVGDLLLLPRNVTGDTKEQAFAWAGKLSPFRVIEREHVYFREPGETVDPRHVKPARYMRSIILVRRLTEEEFDADPEKLR